MNRRLTFLLIMTLLLLIGNSALLAGRLDVAPAQYTWKDVEIGKKIQMPISVFIRNRTKGATSYNLRVVTPSEIKVPLDKGFSKLPSKNWVSFSSKHIVVNSDETVEVKLFLQIPVESKYYDQKWQFYVEVKEDVELGKMIGLACYPKITVLTQDIKKLAKVKEK